MIAIQDYYADHFAVCYGCGRLNDKGLHIKTYMNDKGETETRYTPDDKFNTMEGFVYGGLLASLVDCHGTGSASHAIAKEKGIKIEAYNAPRCVTASLHVNYHKPTPMGIELKLNGVIREVKGRKVIVAVELWAGEVMCVSGEVIAVEVQEAFSPSK